jgi:hypothetical protein
MSTEVPCSPTTLNRIERGLSKPLPGTIDKIEAVFSRRQSQNPPVT